MSSPRRYLIELTMGVIAGIERGELAFTGTRIGDIDLVLTLPL